MLRNDAPNDQVRQSEPDTHPLGGLALGLALFSGLFAVSYLFSLLTYLVAAVAPLGVVHRNEPTRAMGAAAVFITVVATIVATVVLVRT